MTREEYVMLNKELMHDKIILEGQLKRLEQDIKKVGQNPAKADEVLKLKKEETALKKELAAVKEKMTKNYEAKKKAESETFISKAKDAIEKAKDKIAQKMPSTEQVKNLTAAGITAIGIEQDLKSVAKYEMPKPPSNERIIENRKEQKTQSELVFEKVDKLKGEFEKLSHAKEIEQEAKKQEMERQRRIDEMLKKQELKKGKTL